MVYKQREKIPLLYYFSNALICIICGLPAPICPPSASSASPHLHIFPLSALIYIHICPIFAPHICPPYLPPHFACLTNQQAAWLRRPTLRTARRCGKYRAPRRSPRPRRPASISGSPRGMAAIRMRHTHTHTHTHTSCLRFYLYLTLISHQCESRPDAAFRVPDIKSHTHTWHLITQSHSCSRTLRLFCMPSTHPPTHAHPHPHPHPPHSPQLRRALARPDANGQHAGDRQVLRHTRQG
jgi:hypothetical protein